MQRRDLNINFSFDIKSILENAEAQEDIKEKLALYTAAESIIEAMPQKERTQTHLNYLLDISAKKIALFTKDVQENVKNEKEQHKKKKPDFIPKQATETESLAFIPKQATEKDSLAFIPKQDTKKDSLAFIPKQDTEKKKPDFTLPQENARLFKLFQESFEKNINAYNKEKPTKKF